VVWDTRCAPIRRSQFTKASGAPTTPQNFTCKAQGVGDRQAWESGLISVISESIRSSAGPQRPRKRAPKTPTAPTRKGNRLNFFAGLAFLASLRKAFGWRSRGSGIALFSNSIVVVDFSLPLHSNGGGPEVQLAGEALV